MQSSGQFPPFVASVSFCSIEWLVKLTSLSDGFGGGSAQNNVRGLYLP
jgi:hypothetical protein